MGNAILLVSNKKIPGGVLKQYRNLFEKHGNAYVMTVQGDLPKDDLLNEIQTQLDFVSPKTTAYILILGAPSAKKLLGISSITRKMGKLLKFQSYSAMITYAPGVLYHNKELGKKCNMHLRYLINVMNGNVLELDSSYITVDAVDKIKELITCIKNKSKYYGVQPDVVAWDLETEGLEESPVKKIYCIGLCVTDKAASNYVKLIIKYTSLATKLSVLSDLFVAMKKYKTTVITHNGNFDVKWLQAHGVKTAYYTDDTMIMSYMLDNTLSHGLKPLAKLYLGVGDYDKDVNVARAPETRQDYANLYKYCALDTECTARLYSELLTEMLKYDKKLYNLYSKIVIPAALTLAEVYAKGAYVDPLKLDKAIKMYNEHQRYNKAKLLGLDRTIEDINLNSPKQLTELLYDKYKLPVLSKTPKGAPSVDRATLLELAEQDSTGGKIAKAINEYRKVEKILVGFLYPWRDTFLHVDSRLHTTYNIARTATGRLSAQKPNLQQVPRDKNIRSLISAPKDKYIIEADYSQVELRCAAIIAQEKTMLNLYSSGHDLHRYTAHRIVGKPMDKITKEERTHAKSVNFGFLFGMGAWAFQSYAKETYGVELTEDQAKKFRQEYFNAYPCLADWHEHQRKLVRKTGYVVTPFGRIRHLPNIHSHEDELSSRAERQAINTPIQSMAGDLTLAAMVLINKWIKKEKLTDKCCIIGQIHDAILLEVDKDIIQKVGLSVKVIMEKATIKSVEKLFNVDISIPFVADIEVGKAWGLGEELKIAKT